MALILIDGYHLEAQVYGMVVV